MENFSHSLSKKSYGGSNGFSATKTMYDDVFGGPPKLGVPTLSPRVEDYGEIFGGFHSSGVSSIPVLDLPVVDESELSFDVWNSKLDYSEVFGGFDCLDFAVSYEELSNISDGRHDSSEEAWTPAHSGSLSDGSDPSACSEKNQSLLNADSYQSFDGIKQFNISYHKASQGSNGDMSNGMTHVTRIHAVPGYTSMVNENPDLRKIEDGNPSLKINEDFKVSMEYGGGHDEKQFRKSMSHPASNSYGIIGHDADLLAKCGTSDYTLNETFVSVNDISLRTRPSRLPPPSRPPPVFALQKGCSDGPISKLRVSRSYAFERMVGGSAPPFFDVEVDSSSSAAVSSAAMKHALERAEAELRGAKELMERKTECQMKQILENDILKYAEGKISNALNGSNCIKDGSMGGACAKEVNLIQSSSEKEMKYGSKLAKVDSGSKNGKEDIDSAKYLTEIRHGKDHGSYQASGNTEGAFAWREAAQFYEVVEAESYRKAMDQVRDENVWVQVTKSHGQEKKRVEGAERQEDVRTMKATEEGNKWDENDNRLKVPKGAHEWDENKGRSKADKGCLNQKEQQENKVAQRVSELEECERVRLHQQYGETEKLSNKTYKCEECENVKEVQPNENEMEANQLLKEANERTRNQRKVVDANERKVEERLKETFKSEDYEQIFKEAVERSENEKRLEQEEKDQQQKVAHARKENGRTFESTESENILKDAKEKEEIGERLKEAVEQEEREKRLMMALGQEINKKEQEQKLAQGREGNNRWLEGASKLEENEKKLKEALLCRKDEMKLKEADEREENEKRIFDSCEREENGKRLKKAWKREEYKTVLHQASEGEASEKTSHVVVKEEDIVRRSTRDNEWEVTECKDAVEVESFRRQNKDITQNETDDDERKVNLGQEIAAHMEVKNFKASNGAPELDNSETIHATMMARKLNRNKEKLEATHKTFSSKRNIKLNNERQLETVEVENVLIEERLNSPDTEQDNLQQNNQIRIEDVKESPPLGNNKATSNASLSRKINIKCNKAATAFDPENTTVFTQVQEERMNNIGEVQFGYDQETRKDKFTTHQVNREWAENEWKNGDALPDVFESKQNIQNTTQRVRSQISERKEKNLNMNLTTKDREREMLEREKDQENDLLRKIKEEKEREREREKDRMVVDRVAIEARERAFTEARERAFAEAHERAERAAVERVAAEARQRVMAEARERLEKVSAEARLRAERAAVDKATAEARERAFQKAMAERVGFEARERVEKSVADKFPASSRSGELKHSFSFSDVQFNRMGTSGSLKYSYSSVHDGVEGESPQRCKARLERHWRTAERAAKALAEKNMRDLLAQREQAERNRLAETLDAEVKRWSSGKEGNLRALLSTLQYILGPESGWQPIPLTEVITSAAVKKAYRKATLCVHPDKLQQRGANIQQKYICEKVFDLLKEAWNQFNSEER